MNPRISDVQIESQGFNLHEYPEPLLPIFKVSARPRAESALVDPEALDPRLQRRGGEAEEGGGPLGAGDAAGGLGERLLDPPPLGLAQAVRQGDPGGSSGG